MAQRHGLVLVVDDHEEIRAVLREMLAFEGLQVVEAENGPTALEVVRERSPDLMLLDLSMPGMTGLEVLTHLKADPSTAAIRVIVLTGHGELECQEARAAGADECFQKPFQALVLLELIERLLPDAPR